MNPNPNCPGCGKPLPPDAPGGLCPSCLLQSATAVLPANEQPPAVPGDAPRPTPGGSFGNYNIIRLLGRGGMGEVWEADHIETGRRLALKVMNHTLSSDADRKRFLREGRLAASVSHPNVIYVYGSDEIHGIPVIAMELVHEGTLKDTVKNQGPLPVGEAVDHVLQVITGLEAANEAGVLHRDIKPTNCFLASDGTVKVGDFGLSISTLARHESLATASGSVLGTPSLASPEQLRGDELDVRSDIYSVGATLYYLLTGALPFQAEDLVKLIANVLETPPDSPSIHRPDLPPGLVKLILRCLAKDRKQRFNDYRELSRALQPYGSAVAKPGKLGLRFVAGMMDEFVAATPILVGLTFTKDGLDAQFLGERTLLNGALFAGQCLFRWSYYAICEGLLGAGVGKTLCGLRVIKPDGSAPGIWQALKRALVFDLPNIFPLLFTLLIYSAAEYLDLMHQFDFVWTEWLFAPCLIMIFSTMRKSNGFAGLHGLASNTRVVAAEAENRRPRLEPASATPKPIAKSSSIVGPYAEQDRISECNEESVSVGYDNTLRRQVWIHRTRPDTEPVATRRRELHRSTRLRWLNGRREGNENWDAYEAPNGQPLLNLLATAQPWRTVRWWLKDLAEEFHVGRNQDSSTEPFRLDHAWVRQNGQVLMLDFPAPGLEECVADSTAATDLASLQRLLSQVADSARHGLRGQDKAAEGPCPISSRRFIEKLKQSRFNSAEMLLGNLQPLIGRAAVASSRLRINAILIALVPAIALGALILFTMQKEVRDWNTAWEKMFGDRPSLRVVLAEAGPFHSDQIEQVTVYTGNEFGDLLTNKAFWKHPDLGRAMIPWEREFLTNAVATAKGATESERETARKSGLLVMNTWQREYPKHTWISAISVMAASFTFGAIVSFAFVLINGQPPLLRMIDLAVVDPAGEPVSRGRALWRWLLVWTPILLLAFSGFVFMSVDISPRWLISIAFVCLVVFASMLARLTQRPWQSWLEKLTGTFVVPR